jgi:hypothetical protein
LRLLQHTHPAAQLPNLLLCLLCPLLRSLQRLLPHQGLCQERALAVNQQLHSLQHVSYRPTRLLRASAVQHLLHLPHDGRHLQAPLLLPTLPILPRLLPPVLLLALLVLLVLLPRL